MKKVDVLFIDNLVNDRIKAVFNLAQPNNDNFETPDTNLDPISKINTIQKELEAFSIIKVLLKNIITLNKITYKDTESYFGVLFESNTWKWIYRLKLETAKIYNNVRRKL